jgi:hypothetical protein
MAQFDDDRGGRVTLAALGKEQKEQEACSSISAQ